MSDSVGSQTLEFRVSRDEDKPFLKRVLLQQGVLKWFPMCDEREVDDAVRIWTSYAEKEAAITALFEGEIVGMATLYIHSFEKLKAQTLFAIVVDAEKRGRGYGSQILNYLKKLAKEKFQIKLLHLEVYQGNPAYALYKRRGFKEYGRHPRFLKEGPKRYMTKILMQQEL